MFRQLLSPEALVCIKYVPQQHRIYTATNEIQMNAEEKKQEEQIAAFI